MSGGALFGCDLDGTLLVPARHARPDDILVEEAHGRQVSYLPFQSAELLRNLPEHVTFVPVTSRSIEQYRRIKWPEGCEPEMAVVANGGWLLFASGDFIDWRVEPDRWKPKLEAAREKLAGRHAGICRIVDSTYVYLHTAEKISWLDRLMLKRHGFRAYVCGQKLYGLPPYADKGRALAQLSDMLRTGTLISAGDTNMDHGMLRRSGYRIMPRGCGGVEDAVHQPEGVRFQDFVLRAGLSAAGGNGWNPA